MDNNSILSIISIVISVGATILTIINHKRIISKCCGRKLDVSFDINNTTPPSLKLTKPPEPILTNIPNSNEKV